MIIFGKWVGDGYVEYPAYIRSGANVVKLTHSDGQGGISQENAVKNISDVTEPENYWRDHEFNSLDHQEELQGQIVWVSYAQEESNSFVTQGIVIGVSEAPLSVANSSLRIAFYQGKDKIRTFLPQDIAGCCDSFWSETEPQPVYCED